MTVARSVRSEQVRRKAFALVAVAVMLMATLSVIFMVIHDTDVSADDGARDITYHDPVTGSSTTVTYYGTAVAEYNPEYWNEDSLVGDLKNTSGNQVQKWYGDSLGEKQQIVVELMIDWRYTVDPFNRTSTINFPSNVVLESHSERISVNGNQLEVNRYLNSGSGEVSVTIQSIDLSEYRQVFGGWTTREDGGDYYSPG